MIQKSRRFFMSCASVVLASLALASASLAQTYPAKPISILVPYPPGGASDVVARAFNGSLARQLGQPVIVENLAGGGGALAAQKLLNAPGDGYSIFIGSPNEMILAPLANAAVKYKSEDFRFIQPVADMTFAILARGDLPVKNADELIAYAAKRAAEGNPLTYASVGSGSIYHLMGEQLSKITGIPLLHVPYKGGGPLRQDLYGGIVDIYIGGYDKGMIEMSSRGRLKFIATMTPQRLSLIKEVPSVTESKALKDFIYGFWIGFFVKKDTPDHIVKILNDALTKALDEPAVRKILEDQALVVSKPISPIDASQFYEGNTKKFRTIAKSINLTPQ